MLASAEEKLHRFLNSRVSTVVYTALACLTVSFSLEQYAIPLFVLWLLFILVLEDNFLNLFLPMILLNGFAIRTSGQSTILLKHIWLAVPVVIAIVLHFMIHRKKIIVGKQLWAHLAVTVALLLGGLFSISAAEYFSPDALYFVLLLGGGMTFFYVWFRRSVQSNRYFDCREKLMECLYAFGVFCAYSILEQGVRLLLTYGTPYVPYVWANDICVMMLFAIPAAFYYARKHYVHTFVGAGFAGTLLLTNSRAGMLVGGLMLLLCLGYLIRYRKKARLVSILLLVLFSLLALLVFLYMVFARGGLFAAFSAEENGRTLLLSEAWHNFLSAPVFGVGLGARGVTETSFMTINWTHNYLMQVLGSMGLVGVLAYGYQLYVRIRLFLARIDAFTVAAGLSYLSLFLISMLQPGEFCPMPYAVMAVMIFTVLEVSDKEGRESKKKQEIS